MALTSNSLRRRLISWALLMGTAHSLSAQQPADTSGRAVPQRDLFDVLFQILGKPVSNDTLVPLPQDRKSVV